VGTRTVRFYHNCYTSSQLVSSQTHAVVAESSNASGSDQSTQVPAWTQEQISTFRLVAHTMGPVAPGAQLSQNHWSLYLLKTGNTSVRVNMMTSEEQNNDMGVFSVKPHDYQISNSAVHYWDLPAIGQPQIATILQKMGERQRHKYKMTSNGTGCRHWL
jgi:hypothetical protein